MSTAAATAGAEEQLETFLAKYDPTIAQLARDLRAKLQPMLRGALELVYDNYNALVIGYGPSDRASEAILSLALTPRWVNLCFLWGVHLPDPHGLLRGEGNQVRTLRLADPADLDTQPIRELIREAVARSEPPLDPARPTTLVIKSISPKQRPRRPKS